VNRCSTAGAICEAIGFQKLGKVTAQSIALGKVKIFWKSAVNPLIHAIDDGFSNERFFDSSLVDGDRCLVADLNACGSENIQMRWSRRRGNLLTI